MATLEIYRLHLFVYQNHKVITMYFTGLFNYQAIGSHTTRLIQNKLWQRVYSIITKNLFSIVSASTVSIHCSPCKFSSQCFVSTLKALGKVDE